MPLFFHLYCKFRRQQNSLQFHFHHAKEKKERTDTAKRLPQGQYDQKFIEELEHMNKTITSEISNFLKEWTININQTCKRTASVRMASAKGKCRNRSSNTIFLHTTGKKKVIFFNSQAVTYCLPSNPTSFYTVLFLVLISPQCQ